MAPTLIIAGLTIKEALRRRILIAAALIAGLIVLMGFLPLPPPRPNFFDLDPMTLRAQFFAWAGCGMIKFFSSILAVALAAGAISAEVERGVLSTIVPKPLPRLSIYFGKWLGLIVLLAGCLAAWGGLMCFSIWHQTHQYHPRIWLGILAVGLFPLLFTTLTLFFSTVAGFALSAGLSLMAAGCALAEDIIRFAAFYFGAHSLDIVADIVSDIVPLGRMNHWITRGLGDAGRDISAFNLRTPEALGAAAIQTSLWDLAYVFVYIAAFLITGAIVFQRRDL